MGKYRPWSIQWLYVTYLMSIVNYIKYIDFYWFYAPETSGFISGYHVGFIRYEGISRIWEWIFKYFLKFRRRRRNFSGLSMATNARPSTHGSGHARVMDASWTLKDRSWALLGALLGDPGALLGARGCSMSGQGAFMAASWAHKIALYAEQNALKSLMYSKAIYGSAAQK